MKQVLQDLDKGGRTRVVEVPAPMPGRGEVLVRTRCSLISPGTERMLLEFGRSGLLAKARSQPERVRQVLARIRTDGLMATMEAVRSKLAEPLPLGYSNVGVVVGAGDDQTALAFPVGTRVVSNGWHAGFVAVGRNLCVPVPAGVEDETAAFAVLGAIALQGMRLADVQLGDTVFVVGLGLVGQLTVQLLVAAGCRVLASDVHPGRLALARAAGAEVVDVSAGEQPVRVALDATAGEGVAAVLFTAATKSAEPVREAVRMTRRRGAVVMVGVAPIELDRGELFRREIRFQVSCSYGPGRYDAAWENGTRDYPTGLVRWTARGNFESVLAQMAAGRIDTAPLTTHRFSIADAAHAYEVVLSDAEALAVVLEYPADTAEPARTVGVAAPRARPPRASGAIATPRLAMIGAGNFARRTLLPALAREACRIDIVCSARGTSAAEAARRFGIPRATTDVAAVMADDAVDGVVIATRHDSHAAFAGEALAAGRAVFLEKPLATSLEQLAALAGRWRDAAEPPRLVLGLNRRNAPMIIAARDFIAAARAPLCMDYTVNAGAVERDSWVQQADIGGGRLIGEVCHFVDTLQSLAGGPWHTLWAVSIRHAGGSAVEDQATLCIRFGDGSIGSIHYWANGPRTMAKEHLRLVAGGRAAVMENFLRLELHDGARVTTRRAVRQDKGHRATLRGFIAMAARRGPAPVAVQEYVDVTLATFAARAALATGQPQTLEQWRNRLWAIVPSE